MAELSILQRLHDSEINGSVRWFFGGDWAVRLGDELNGWKAEGLVSSLDEALDWLDQKARELYPDSDYAKSDAAKRDNQ